MLNLETQPLNQSPSWYQTNLDITKRNVWPSQTFSVSFLRKVVVLVLDELIKQYPNKSFIPMELINIYDLVEQESRSCTELACRLKLYATYSALLYTYINKHVGHDNANNIFEMAKLTVLYDEQQIIEPKIRALPKSLDNC